MVGASSNRSKFGNKVLRHYQRHNRAVYAINPRSASIEGAPTVPSLSDVPEPLHGISVVTPPGIAESVALAAMALGIRRVWFQPGAESEAAIAMAKGAGIEVIAGGPCLLVALG